MFARFLRGLHPAALAAAALLPSLSAVAADFSATNTGAIADNTTRTLSFAVNGINGPITDVSVSLDIQHTWVGDLVATLYSPTGKAHLVLFSNSGRLKGTTSKGSDVSGGYRFSDAAVADWWATLLPLSTSTTIPAGTYRTSTAGTVLSNHGGCTTSLNGAFAGLADVDANGTWTLTIADVGPGDTGTISAATLSIRSDDVFATSFETPVRGVCKLAQFDFTGTGRTSYTILHKAQNPITWYVQNNDGTTNGTVTQFDFGNPNTDYELSGDFDGDGIADAAIWTPGAEGVAAFHIRRSSRPADVPQTIVFGKDGDTPPFAADFDGDGLDDVVLYRDGATISDPSKTLIRLSSTGAVRTLTTGEGGMTSFATGGLDYNGDAIPDVVIQSNGGSNTALFRVYNGTNGTILDSLVQGYLTDYVMPGAYAGTEPFRADITNRRSSGGNHVWTTHDTESDTTQPDLIWGVQGDIDVGGDYDGDGFDDYAFWRQNADPAQTFFSVRSSVNPLNTITVTLGQQNDYPIANSREH